MLCKAFKDTQTAKIFGIKQPKRCAHGSGKSHLQMKSMCDVLQQEDPTAEVHLCFS